MLSVIVNLPEQCESFEMTFTLIRALPGLTPAVFSLDFFGSGRHAGLHIQEYNIWDVLGKEESKLQCYL